MKKSEILKILKNLYPDTGHITVSYSGSNDSFSDFYDFSAYSHCKIKNSKLLDTFSEKGRPVSKDVDKIGKDLGVHNSDLDRCIWAVLDSHSEVGFDNDGCEGEVVFDLDNKKIFVYNRYRVTETVDSPEYEYGV